MDIRRLKHFLYLAEETRFALAAERAHLSQAAFSRSIQSFEDRLGVKLFDRNTHGATLTPAGDMLLERARALVSDSRCLEQDIALYRTGDAGELAIGSAPVPAATIVPELLCRLNRHSPKLITRIRFGYLGTLLEQLDAHELDFCLGDPRQFDNTAGRYSMRAVGKQHGILCCRAGHPLSSKDKVSAETIKHYGIAMITLTPDLNSLLVHALQLKTGEPLPVTVECDDFTTLAHVICQTDVIGILPQALVRQSANTLRPLNYTSALPISVDVHAVWLKNRTLSPSAERAIALAQAVSVQSPQ